MPKGVMITHANMIAAVGGFGKCFDVHPDDVYLSYLPLAHVLAMTVSNACFHYGCQTGFGVITRSNRMKKINVIYRPQRL